MLSEILLFSLVSLAQNSDDSEIRRFTLIVGANSGGPNRSLLRYAEADADAFSQVLLSLGGVASSDEIRLTQPSIAMLRDAFLDLASKIESDRDRSRRVELVMYYSGHSDAKGLLLAEERMTYSELKTLLTNLPVDVRIAILDACQSGAMTRSKGGVRRLPFLVDNSSHVHGYAAITSSSETEVAQESDQLKGSFFTHYLVSALRGAGDVTEDRKITLNEAYLFAFHETLRRTQNSLGGTQHPAYDLQLVGSGDVVMTDLRATSTLLVIGKLARGRFYIYNAKNQLEAEIRKDIGQNIEIGLEPGEYKVLLEQDGKISQSYVTLFRNSETTLQLDRFRQTELELTLSRGDVMEAQKVIRPHGAGTFRLKVGSGATTLVSDSNENFYSNRVSFAGHLSLGYYIFDDLELSLRLDGLYAHGAHCLEEKEPEQESDGPCDGVYGGETIIATLAPSLALTWTTKELFDSFYLYAGGDIGVLFQTIDGGGEESYAGFDNAPGSGFQHSFFHFGLTVGARYILARRLGLDMGGRYFYTQLADIDARGYRDDVHGFGVELALGYSF